MSFGREIFLLANKRAQITGLRNTWECVKWDNIVPSETTITLKNGKDVALQFSPLEGETFKEMAMRMEETTKAMDTSNHRVTGPIKTISNMRIGRSKIFSTKYMANGLFTLTPKH